MGQLPKNNKYGPGAHAQQEAAIFERMAVWLRVGLLSLKCWIRAERKYNTVCAELKEVGG